MEKRKEKQQEKLSSKHSFSFFRLRKINFSFSIFSDCFVFYFIIFQEFFFRFLLRQ